MHTGWYGVGGGTTYSLLGKVTIGGTWTLGIPGATATHTVFGNLNVSGPAGSGGCIYTNATLVAGSCTSDERFKRDIVPLAGSLRRIVSLRPVEYAWRTEEFPDRNFSEQRETGLIAQEVQRVFPEYVSQGQDGYYRVQYGLGIQMHMLSSIQELNAKVETLEAQNARMEAQNVRIEAQNARMAALLCKRFPEEFPCE